MNWRNLNLLYVMFTFWTLMHPDKWSLLTFRSSSIRNLNSDRFRSPIVVSNYSYSSLWTFISLLFQETSLSHSIFHLMQGPCWPWVSTNELLYHICLIRELEVEIHMSNPNKNTTYIQSSLNGSSFIMEGAQDVILSIFMNWYCAQCAMYVITSTYMIGD